MYAWRWELTCLSADANTLPTLPSDTGPRRPAPICTPVCAYP